MKIKVEPGIFPKHFDQSRNKKIIISEYFQFKDRIIVQFGMFIVTFKKKFNNYIETYLSFIDEYLCKYLVN
jgi:hypothetical protein